ncbi:MAG: YifB family Mg chelatase-like AAA ATPase [Pseudomonadota bacterium]
MASYAQVLSRAGVGLEAPLVEVEVHLQGGLPGFTLVGLPAAAVRESRDRIKSAIRNCGFKLPQRRIVVNLAPADLPKEGGRFDLPIAVGLLAAAGLLGAGIDTRLARVELLGELALTGAVRPIRGVLPAAIACARADRELFVPSSNVEEALLVAACKVTSAASLSEVVRLLERSDPDVDAPDSADAVSRSAAPEPEYPCLSEVRGQGHARRALEIAAAGGHNLLLSGPPGTGKTLLATRLPGLLPPLNESEAAEVAAIESIGTIGFDPANWRRRPFRAPHHSASHAAMVGGGSRATPGEISLAHRGVLFLDELPEFQRNVLEVLREPLESGVIHLSRAGYKVRFPASVQLVAAMNPCNCGFLGDGTNRCECAPGQIARYRNRISGPLLDRIDLHVHVPQQSLTALRRAPAGETTLAVRERVLDARATQMERSGKLNARLDVGELGRECRLGEMQLDMLEAAADRLQLSARAANRVLKVARTIADLAGREAIAAEHLLEAIGYRARDRTA